MSELNEMQNWRGLVLLVAIGKKNVNVRDFIQKTIPLMKAMTLS